MMIALAISLAVYYLATVVYLICDLILEVRAMERSGEITEIDLAFVLALVSSILLALVFAPIVFPWFLWHQIRR
jgi:hypothetical protein